MVSYNSRKQKPFVPYPFYSSVVDLASNNNVVVLCCALNDETRHMINREVMVALGKGVVIVNVARGAVIDEKQLLRCLMEGEIGGCSTLESYVAICQLLGRNLEAFFSNNPLITPVI
ncbi:glyoxylate/hydroxypyruvate reductase HPR3-like [Phaseolus vulgaris]|uniref:glyoxylate/hydroxypyruvate reductase HPR3-like n=1 Tax=Phaseolus vulgaris TaxID=3885 RepID=UPI0035CA6F68